MLIFLIIFSIILIGRFNNFLFGFETLNIDESQMMANAIRFEKNGYNIFEFDGTSSGFLNSLVLNWPNFFGLDVTFLSTRISAITFISLIFFFCYLFFRTEINKTLSFLLTLPGIILFAFTHDPDYLHYSSELLSTLFIIICLCCYKVYSKTKKNYFLYIGIFLISLIIFSKTQIILTAITLAFSIFIFVFIEKNYKISFNCAFLFLGPILLILLIYVHKGFFYDYYLNYFEFSKAVVLKNSIGENIVNSDISNVNLTDFNKLKNHIILNSTFHFFYFQILISFLLLLFIISKKNYQKLLNTSFLLNIFCVLSVLISILITGSIYRHYFIPLVPLSSIFVGSIFITVKDEILNSKIKQLPIYFLSLIFLITFAFEKDKFYSKKIKKTAYTKEELNFYSPRLLDYLRPKNETIYIWGWNPQLYVLSNLYPSARATISQKNIQNYSNKEYFDDRLLNDLKINKPDIIFDYVKSKSFLYTDKNKSIKNSILKDLIDLEYIIIDNNDPDCPDLYLEKNNYKKFQKKIINFNFTDARLTKINNFSITKEICDDSVLFDQSFEDNIVLKFDNESRVKTILILSSHLNDKKIQMNIKLINKKEVFSEDIILKKYPFWTEIAISNDNLMTELILEISNLKKLNYGINEIKIYKD